MLVLLNLLYILSVYSCMLNWICDKTFRIILYYKKFLPTSIETPWFQYSKHPKKPFYCKWQFHIEIDRQIYYWAYQCRMWWIFHEDKMELCDIYWWGTCLGCQNLISRWHKFYGSSRRFFFCVYIAYDTKRTEEFYYFRKKIHFKYILVERSAVTADSASLHAVDSKNFKAFIKIRMVIYFYL